MRKITVTEYNKVIATFETFDALKDWLKTDYREQWWINGYKNFIKEINKNIENGKTKIFEYGSFKIEENIINESVKMKKYLTRDRENGNIIGCFNTKEEAEQAIKKGIYEPHFYEVVELNKGERTMKTVNERMNDLIKFVEDEINDDNKLENAHVYYHDEVKDLWGESEVSFVNDHMKNYKKVVKYVTDNNGMIIKTDPLTLSVIVRFSSKY